MVISNAAPFERSCRELSFESVIFVTLRVAKKTLFEHLAMVVSHVMYEYPFSVNMTIVLDGHDGKVPYSFAYHACADASMTAFGHHQ